MTQDQYIAFVKSELANITSVIEKKNKDYSGGSNDALANFKLAEELGLANAEIGLLIRMMDKVQRIKSFLSRGSLQVSDEPAQDAVRDIIGYSVALLALIEDKKPKSTSGVITVQSGIGSMTTITEDHGFISMNRKSGAV